jgi:hypothetical protein
MATWIETQGSRSANISRKGLRAESNVSVTYKVLGAADDIAVHNEANTFFSANRFYQIGDYTMMVDSYSINHLGDDAWEVTAIYKTLGADDEAQPFRRTRAFDTTGGTQHMTQTPEASGEKRWGVDGEGDAPFANYAINADENGVRGVDVIAPALQWSETYDVPSTYVTAAYIKTVATLTGTVNNGNFRTFAPGEVLFAGCTGSQQWDSEKGDSPWQLSYKFIASPNAGPGQSLPAINCGTVTGVEKKGHEYLWVRYEDGISPDEHKAQIKKPKYVYVNKVYRESNFGALGIGTT